jgi:prolyl 4-hydroxylase
MIADPHAAARRGDFAAAAEVLRVAAAAGDRDAAMQLAWWNLQGRGIARSLRRARHYFGRAAELGQADAQLIYAALLANGTGGDSEWQSALSQLQAAASDGVGDASAQLDLVGAMAIDSDGNPTVTAAGERVSDRPWASLFQNFLTPDECAYLIRAAEPALVPAPVGHVAGIGQRIVQQIRTCDAAGFPWVAENPAINAINRRIAAASGTDAEWGEPLQVMRYRRGQEFKPHRDCTEDVANQRIFTMLIYLNDDYEGGETLFLNADLKIRGRAGDALLFRNADDDGNPNMDTLHAGLPVRSGEKYLASRWIRRRRFGPEND